MGKVMACFMPKVKGKADGSLVNKLYNNTCHKNLIQKYKRLQETAVFFHELIINIIETNVA